MKYANLPSVCQDPLATGKSDHRNNLLPMFVDHGRGKRTKCSVLEQFFPTVQQVLLGLCLPTYC